MILMFLDQLLNGKATTSLGAEVQVLYPGWWQVCASRGEAFQEDHGAPVTLNDGHIHQWIGLGKIFPRKHRFSHKDHGAFLSIFA